MVALSEVMGGLADDIAQGTNDSQSDEEMIAVVERALLAQLDKIGLKQTDARIDTLEQLGRIDSTIRIDEAAEIIGLSVRQLERCSLDSLGLTPKAFLRRCRFLDTAMAMRGFTSPSAESLAALRYFDQSHLNREFRRFIDMTPRRFQKAITPLMDEGLRLRHEGDDYVANV
jgi:AraC-like DNA-binding protein